MGRSTEIVTEFVTKWRDGPEAIYRSIEDYFTDETIWENVGLAITTGADEAMTLHRRFEIGVGVHSIDIEILAIAEVGDLVLTERTDRFLRKDGTEISVLRLMGIFEIRGERIQSWRDYFDPSAIPTP